MGSHFGVVSSNNEYMDGALVTDILAGQCVFYLACPDNTLLYYKILNEKKN